MRMLRAYLPFQLREGSLDEKNHTAEFVASTERAVPMGPWEPEVLRMSGCRLERYQSNPVLLDSHDRTKLSSVIGSTEVRVEGRQLISRHRYADTAAGEDAWKLVKGGHVRAVSIGYSINEKKVRKLRKGEFDGEGAGRVEGPANVVGDWELLEVSQVAVPADEDAVRRELKTRAAVYGRGDTGNCQGMRARDEGKRPLPEVTYCPGCGEEVEFEPDYDDPNPYDGKIECPECGKTFSIGDNMRGEVDSEGFVDEGHAKCPKCGTEAEFSGDPKGELECWECGELFSPEAQGFREGNVDEDETKAEDKASEKETKAATQDDQGYGEDGHPKGEDAADGQESGRDDGMATCPDCGKSFALPERTDVVTTPAGGGHDSDVTKVAAGKGGTKAATGSPQGGTQSGKAGRVPLVRGRILNLRSLEILKRDAAAITPRGLEHVAEQAILDGCRLESIRERLLKAQAKRMKPVGTPSQEQEVQTRDVTDDVLARSLEQLSG